MCARRLEPQDRVQLNPAYFQKWKMPEWKQLGNRKGTVIYADTGRIDVLFDRVHPTRGRDLMVTFTNPESLKRCRKSRAKCRNDGST